jgi:hypothetical protein
VLCTEGLRCSVDNSRTLCLMFIGAESGTKSSWVGLKSTGVRLRKTQVSSRDGIVFAVR